MIGKVDTGGALSVRALLRADSRCRSLVEAIRSSAASVRLRVWADPPALSSYFDLLVRAIEGVQDERAQDNPARYGQGYRGGAVVRVDAPTAARLLAAPGE